MRIPKRFGSDVVRSHSPQRDDLRCRGVLSRLPYGAPNNGAVLTGPLSTAKKLNLIRGNGISWLGRFRLKHRTGLPSVGGSAISHPNRLSNIFRDYS